MASPQDVRRYLAHWMQLGKPVLSHGGDRVHQPQPVFVGDRYSPAFEQCWQVITAPESGDCYLQGTDETIAELLSEAWELHPCARCSLLIPLAVSGYGEPGCPCFDLSNWPNSEIPVPRDPVSTQAYLSHLQTRLSRWQPAIAASFYQDQRQSPAVSPSNQLNSTNRQAQAG